MDSIFLSFMSEETNHDFVLLQGMDGSRDSARCLVNIAYHTQLPGKRSLVALFTYGHPDCKDPNGPVNLGFNTVVAADRLAYMVEGFWFSDVQIGLYSDLMAFPCDARYSSVSEGDLKRILDQMCEENSEWNIFIA